MRKVMLVTKRRQRRNRWNACDFKERLSNPPVGRGLFGKHLKDIKGAKDFRWLFIDCSIIRCHLVMEQSAKV